MALNLGQVLSQSGPTLGTGREQTRYIDIADLVADERNFYELSGIDALAANIELIGLQQPIRVRELSGNPGKFRIVSGHRRRAAIQKLVDEGREDLRSVHCIVETVECSEAMQELRLIYANSDTRKMSSADLSRQAERVEALLYQLKEEGFEFPGRMRDHVAQACQTTKSKLSRLKVIREKLHPTFLAGWESGEINDSVAYRIAQEDERVQEQLFSNTGYAARHWTVDAAENAINRVKNPPVIKPVISGGFNVQKMANDYLEQRAEENRWFFENMKNHIFDMMIGGFTVIPSRQDGIQYLKDYHSNGAFWGTVHFDRSKTGLEVYKDSESSEKTKRSWTEVWDAMACIALQRCAEQHNKPKQKEPETKPQDKNYTVGWNPNKIRPEDGQHIVFIDKDGLADNDVYQAGTLKSGEMFGNTWDDVVMWTPEPEALPPDEEDT